MTNYARTLYTGVTNDLERRVHEHKMKLIPGFTAKYGLTSLVYYEFTEDISTAIVREKQIKGWLRSKKLALIESMNPEWRDLSLELFDCHSEGAKRLKNPFNHRRGTDPSLRSG
jgi:putative endonuclease